MKILYKSGNCFLKLIITSRINTYIHLIRKLHGIVNAARQQQQSNSTAKCSEWYDMTFPVFMQPCNDSLYAFACYVAWINCNLYICVERDCIKLKALFFAIILLCVSLRFFLDEEKHSNSNLETLTEKK